MVNHCFSGEIQLFWALQAWILYFATPCFTLLRLASPRFTSLCLDSAIGFALNQFKPSGAKKLNFWPLKNGLTTLLLQVVNKALFLTSSGFCTPNWVNPIAKCGKVINEDILPAFYWESLISWFSIFGTVFNPSCCFHHRWQYCWLCYISVIFRNL